jgi:site-specific recombinase XerD
MVTSTALAVPGTSLRSLVGAFILARITEGKSPRTVEFYAENLRRFLWFAEKEGWPDNIHQITIWHLRLFLGYVASATCRWGLEGNGAETSRHRASHTTVLRYRDALRCFFSWLVDEGILAQDPTDRIQMKREPPKVVTPYAPDEIRRLLAVCDYDFEHDSRFLASRTRAMVLVLLDTGLRLSELLRMKLDDINPKTGCFKVVGKGGKERFARVGRKAQAALAQHQTHRPDCGRRELWLTEKGEPLSTNAFQCLMKRLKERAGVSSEGSIHRFRHTFAVQFLRADRNVFNLQYLLGHSDLRMVRRYTMAMGMDDALAAHEAASPADQLDSTQA